MEQSVGDFAGNSVSNITRREIIKRCGDGRILHEVDSIIREVPYTLFVNEIEFVTLVCTPEHIEALGVGFLLSEGLVQQQSDITRIEVIHNGGFVKIATAQALNRPDQFLRRNIASCCGKGRAGLYFINDAKQVQEVISGHRFNAQHLSALMEQLENQAALFHQTGGTHFAALADEQISCMFEDIGRHNAVDKVLGYALMNNLLNENLCLIFSGRISSEIVIKAARGKVPLIYSKAAPTDLAVDLAEDLNICIIGFGREKRMNIYTHPEKLI